MHNSLGLHSNQRIRRRFRLSQGGRTHTHDDARRLWPSRWRGHTLFFRTAERLVGQGASQQARCPRTTGSATRSGGGGWQGRGRQQRQGVEGLRQACAGGPGARRRRCRQRGINEAAKRERSVCAAAASSPGDPRFDPCARVRVTPACLRTQADLDAAAAATDGGTPGQPISPSPSESKFAARATERLQTSSSAAP